MSELFKKALPKWPNLMLVGEPVTKDQATEIILRTDDFIYGDGHTNEREFEKKFHQLTGLDRGFTFDYGGDQKPDFYTLSLYQQALAEKLNRVRLSYVKNSWTACSYIYGPHGFCSPSGEVFFRDNIGKYPGVEEVFDDMVKIAEAFPFLDFKASLYDGEDGEEDDRPLNLVVSFSVKDGKVEINETDYGLHQHRQERDMVKSFLNRTELGLPDSTLYAVIPRVREATDAIIADPPSQD